MRNQRIDTFEFTSPDHELVLPDSDEHGMHTGRTHYVSLVTDGSYDDGDYQYLGFGASFTSPVMLVARSGYDGSLPLTPENTNPIRRTLWEYWNPSVSIEYGGIQRGCHTVVLKVHLGWVRLDYPMLCRNEVATDDDADYLIAFLALVLNGVCGRVPNEERTVLLLHRLYHEIRGTKWVGLKGTRVAAHHSHGFIDPQMTIRCVAHSRKDAKHPLHVSSKDRLDTVQPVAPRIIWDTPPTKSRHRKLGL